MLNIIELSRRLHQERIFTKHEQETIWKLNKQVQTHAEQVSHSFWITRQHYLNLNKLILNSAQGTAAACCRNSHSLETVQFVDGCKELGYQEETMYSQFLEAFLNNPTLIAACLVYGDKLGLDITASVCHTVVLGCYGNNIMTDDHKHLLELMETLMLLQLASDDQPRRLLQKGTCAFSVILKLFMESLPLGKLFLTFALHKPVMEVLMDDDLLLETNQQKILTILSSFELERRFGKQDSVTFQEKMQEHVEKAKKQLSKKCGSFINNLFSAMSCFPQSLGWIIAKSYQIVKDGGLVSQEEARALCADIFLQQFVCPAIVTPELYGVTGDVPVSDLSRANLMQIAQVLQVLAHSEENVQKQDSINSQLNTDPMQSLIDAVINACSSDTVPTKHKSPLGYANSAVFFTPFQLSQMIQFLKAIQDSGVRGVDQSSLQSVLAYLPTQPPPCLQNALILHDLTTLEEEAISNVKVVGSITPSGGSSNDLGDLPTSSPLKKGFTKNGKGKRSSKKDYHDILLDDNLLTDLSSFTQNDTPSETVLVITLNSMAGSSQEFLGTMTENEVMELQRPTASANLPPVENTSLDVRSLTETEGLEKRSRFSLYSGGSDLSEIDEELPTEEDGISRTSRSSSIDIDPTESVPPDDTSSIHAVSIQAENQDEDEEEGVDQGSVSRANNDEALKALRRKLPTSRGESIEDKMRKFEIGRELGVRFADAGVMGEARQSGSQGGSAHVDTRSETWSIDAYASDSEPQTEQESQTERLQELVDENSQPPTRSSSNLTSFLLPHRDEDSRSDVWSVEVLAGDSEPPDGQTDDRLQEFESETTIAPSEYVMEDNRSRASTPGLSAASGFSGVSALSAVSESHTKVLPGDDAWPNSERSFIKEPSSVSPDADDMQFAKESSSGGSHSNGNDQNARVTVKTNSFSSLKSQHHPSLVINKNQKDFYETNKIHKGNELENKSLDALCPLPKTSSAMKTVMWNDADLSSSSAVSSKTAGTGNSDLSLLDFTDNVDTIKRSPYKKQVGSCTSTLNKLSSDPPIAWDENTTGAVIIKSQMQTADILKDFDPLTMENENKSDCISNDIKTVAKNEKTENESEEFKPGIVTANGGIELATSRPESISSKLETSKPDPDPDKTPPLQSDLSKPNQHDFSESSSGFFRRNKKPWWKNISKKKVSSTPIDLLRGRSTADIISGSPESFQKSQKKQNLDEATINSPGDDIMSKYMKKVNPKPRSELDSALSESLPNVKNPETGDVPDGNSTNNLTPSNSSYENKSTISGDASSSVPFVSGWSGDIRSSESVTAEVEFKSSDVSAKTDADLKEEAKRKLRIVFSSAEPLPESPSLELLLLGITSSSANFTFAPQNVSAQGSNKLKLREHLLSFLRTQHAEALTLLMHSRVAQIDEVIRCVQALDDQGCKQVIKSLWKEYKQRSSYVAYLVRSRQHLLAALSYLRHVTECTERDKAICRRYFTVQCVRMFLKDKRIEGELVKFRNKFVRSIALDEKVSLINNFLSWLYGNMVANPIWDGASQEHLKEGEACIERYLFSWIYKPAMFPNGDGDTNRDQVFHDHIARLSAVVTPAHSALQINPKYLLECPWPSAQREVSALAAFRSPRGKLEAALRCCRAVMHLLKMADESGVPAADDFTPVLVFVLIKANPPHLLSTLQYVEHFLGDSLSGEDAYWWMQFSAATLFIKTIDERK